MLFASVFIVNFLLISADVTEYNGHCDGTKMSCPEPNWTDDEQNLIFYDVNPSEGFNLRRDVYMRFAIMLAEAQKRGNHLNWYLVLPPWFGMYHWRTQNPRTKPIPWSKFFDIESLKSYAPVLEMHELFSIPLRNGLEIETIYVLQNFENAFENGDFHNKWEIGRHCSYDSSFWGYDNITAKEVLCLKFQGNISQFWKLFAFHHHNTVMFHHAEIPLHDQYGNKAYWDCRKSMKFNNKLIEKAKEYISNELGCTTDKCSNYLSIHWRRQDFAKYRQKDVPSISGTAKQVDKIIKRKSLSTNIFIATDATTTEKKELEKQFKELGYTANFYLPTANETLEFLEGGIAIIEQIVCSRAAYFIGTHESTFSYRIQEEREILGFDSSSTFNRLCPDEGECEQPSKWTIVN